MPKPRLSPTHWGAIKGRDNQVGIPSDAPPATLTSASVGLLKLNPNYASAQSMPGWSHVIIFKDLKGLESNYREVGGRLSLPIRNSLPFVGRELSSDLWEVF
jgi:hypothetical protein